MRYANPRILQIAAGAPTRDRDGNVYIGWALVQWESRDDHAIEWETHRDILPFGTDGSLCALLPDGLFYGFHGLGDSRPEFGELIADVDTPWPR